MPNQSMRGIVMVWENDGTEVEKDDNDDNDYDTEGDHIPQGLSRVIHYKKHSYGM